MTPYERGFLRVAAPGVFLIALGLGGLAIRDLRGLQPFGRFTENQIVDRSRELCRILMPADSNMLYSAEQIECVKPSTRSDVRHWFVRTIRDVDTLPVHLLWDADTGSLLQLSAGLPVRGSPKQKPMPEEWARRVLAQWATKLQQLGQFPVRQTEVHMARTGLNWRAAWLVGDKKLRLEIDARTGDFVNFFAYGMP